MGFPLSKNADVENADACLCVCAYGLCVCILSTGGDGGRCGEISIFFLLYIKSQRCRLFVCLSVCSLCK